MSVEPVWSELELAAQDGAIGKLAPISDERELYRPSQDEVVTLFEALDAADPGDTSAMIAAVENSMVVAVHLDTGLRMIDILPKHLFTDDEYLRRVEIPAGVLVTSRIHRDRHQCVVTEGSITIWSLETGIQHIDAPYVFESYPGSHRIGYTHEDTVWTTIHPNPGGSEDVEATEERLFEPFTKPELRPETLAVIAQIDRERSQLSAATEETE